MTINQALIDILTKASEKVGIFIDWTSQQTVDNLIPYLSEICGKIVAYEIATSTLWIVVAGVSSFISVSTIKKSKKKIDECLCDDEVVWGMLIIMCAIIFVICIVTLITQTMNVITAITFPELTVVDFVKGYISNNQ